MEKFIFFCLIILAGLGFGAYKLVTTTAGLITLIVPFAIMGLYQLVVNRREWYRRKGAYNKFLEQKLRLKGVSKENMEDEKLKDKNYKNFIIFAVLRILKYVALVGVLIILAINDIYRDINVVVIIVNIFMMIMSCRLEMKKKFVKGKEKEEKIYKSEEEIYDELTAKDKKIDAIRGYFLNLINFGTLILSLMYLTNFYKLPQ